MPHAFDAKSLGQSAIGLSHLIARARDHERRFTELVNRLEQDDSPGDHLSALRALCAEARDQRQFAEEILNALMGGRSMEPDVPRRVVLIVDDSDEIREVMGELLEASGFEVVTARNGLEAVIAAHYAQPAVVLMDVAMPLLDGIEAARLLKESDATQHVKLIASTANPESYRDSLARLFVQVLRKPVAPEAVLAAVQRFVPGV